MELPFQDSLIELAQEEETERKRKRRRSMSIWGRCGISMGCGALIQKL
jgi:hypothetical protein